MELFVIILVSALALVFLYVIYKKLFFDFAKKEIEKSSVIKRKDDTFVIYANKESLEYYIRMARGLGRKTKVIINIEKNSADTEELTYIARVCSGRAGNITIHYI